MRAQDHGFRYRDGVFLRFCTGTGILPHGVVIGRDPARGRLMPPRLTFAMAIWLVFWPLSETVFPRRQRADG
jgi:hypothetical protein